MFGLGVNVSAKSFCGLDCFIISPNLILICFFVTSIAFSVWLLCPVVRTISNVLIFIAFSVWLLCPVVRTISNVNLIDSNLN